MRSATIIIGASLSLIAGLTAFSVQRGDGSANAPLNGVAVADTPAAASPDGQPLGSPWSERRRDREEEEFANWQRPAGPVRVALQAGHWKAAEAPDEQRGLRTNGTRGGGLAEWQVNLAIAERTAELLRAAGLEVEILPTTIPPSYWADLFVSIHADGNPNTSVSGYRAAPPRRDRTGRAREFSDLLTRTYGEATGLPLYPTVTRRMTSYYAFNSRRYDHALHPMTVGVILETGFLTNARDRRIIVNAQDRAAQGIATAVIQFLEPVVALQEAIENATVAGPDDTGADGR